MMTRSLIRAWLARLGAPLTGAVFCAAFILVPEVAAMTGATSTERWIPVNSQYRMSSDAYFYAAAVEEMREGFFQHSLPATQEGGPILAFDQFRVTTYRILAAGGLFFPDPRYAYLLSFVLLFVLNFLLLWWLGRELGLGSFASTTAAIAAVLWERFPQYLDPLIGRPTFLSYWPEFLARFFRGDLDFEAFNNHTRYAILGAAISFLWLFLIALVRFDTRPTRLRAAILATTALLLMYAYPALVVVGLAIGATYLGRCAIRRDKQRVVGLLLAGLVTVVVALLIGVRSDLVAALAPGGAIETHPDVRPGGFDAVARVLRDRSFTLVVLVAVVAGAWFRRNALLIRSFAHGVIVAGALLLLAQLAPRTANIAEVMQVRGYASVLLFTVFAAALGLAGYEGQRRGSPRWAQVVRGGLLVLVLLIVTVPAMWGSVALGRVFTTSAELHVPEGQWEAYEYLRSNANPNDVVVAMDWEDVQLLPVYTDVDLFFGDVSFSGRPAVDEVRRYLRAWVAFGYPLDLLKMRLTNAVKDGSRVGYASPSHALPRPQAEGPMLLRHLFYDPYIKEFAGGPIRDAKTNDLDPAFIGRVFDLLPEPAGPSPLGDPAVAYVVLSREYEELRPTPFAAPAGFRQVLRNDARTVYAREPR